MSLRGVRIEKIPNSTQPGMEGLTQGFFARQELLSGLVAGRWVCSRVDKTCVYFMLVKTRGFLT
jgi:hypothetical protein